MKAPFQRFFLTVLCVVLLAPFGARAQSLAQKLAGKIVLNVAGKGEAWYINPTDKKRYYLGRPADAFAVMRRLGLGIAEIDFQKIAQAGMTVTGDRALASRLAGRIILQTERNGEAWYVNPSDLKKYYLGRPADAFAVMRQLSLGISKEDLARINKPGTAESLDAYSKYEQKYIPVSGGNFLTDIVTIELDNPKLKIVTDTADSSNCQTGCSARSLGSYVFDQQGSIGMNGSYFDTSSGKKNYYFFPVFNTAQAKMINEDQLKWWTTGPLMAFDQNNNFYYFKDSRDFKSVADFEKKYGVKLQASIGNKPRLIEEKMITLIDWEVDEKQRNVKSLRNAIAYDDHRLYLVIVHNATIVNLADVVSSLGAEYALNLDGGFSSALFYNDEYKIGPGRDIPNAIIFKFL
jgi:exopolysaccharide biosynthesis protein